MTRLRVSGLRLSRPVREVDGGANKPEKSITLAASHAPLASQTDEIVALIDVAALAVLAKAAYAVPPPRTSERESLPFRLSLTVVPHPQREAARQSDVPSEVFQFGSKSSDKN